MSARYHHGIFSLIFRNNSVTSLKRFSCSNTYGSFGVGRNLAALQRQQSSQYYGSTRSSFVVELGCHHFIRVCKSLVDVFEPNECAAVWRPFLAKHERYRNCRIERHELEENDSDSNRTLRNVLWRHWGPKWFSLLLPSSIKSNVCLIWLHGPFCDLCAKQWCSWK